MTSSTAFRPQAPLPRQRRDRVGVIDIGSNSLRLVVYDRLCRSPVPIFNEKILCGLGKDVGETGRLNPDGFAAALENLHRFKQLLGAMEVERVDVLATAAVREAGDGPAFVDRITRECGLDVQVISGQEEGRLAALGVLSGIPGADGIVGDLGGGSLELAGIDGGVLGEQVTLPLGPFRMGHLKLGRPEADLFVDRALDRIDWLADLAGRSFYPVGGAWRALAKVLLARTDHPVKVIQHLAADPEELAELAGLIARQGRASLEKLPGVPKRRLETLPAAAQVMKGVLARIRPRTVIFSANGVREGHMFDLLSPQDQAEDPLLYTTRMIAETTGRFGDAHHMADWLVPFFVQGHGDGTRLVTAACRLSDIAWREHPDYRAEHAFYRVLRLHGAGMTHPERVILATALYLRYGGAVGDDLLGAPCRLIDPAQLDLAHRMGLLLRLAHTVSGGAMAILARTRLTLSDGGLDLALPHDLRHLAGEVVQRRLDACARLLGVTGRIVPALQTV